MKPLRSFIQKRAWILVLIGAGLIPWPVHAAEPVTEDAPAADPAASEALLGLVKSLRSRPGLTVKTTLQVEVLDTNDGKSSKGPEVSAEITHRKDGAGILKIRGFTCAFKDGVMVVTHSDTQDHSYFTDRFEDAYWTLVLAFRDLAFPHLALFWGDENLVDLGAELHPRSDDIVPSSVSDGAADGKAIRTITLASPNASLALRVDPASMLVTSAIHEIKAGQFVQPGCKIITTYRFENETMEVAPDDSLFTLKAGDRQRVDMLAALVNRPVAPAPNAPGEEGPAPAGGLVGKPAPALVLSTTDGKAVDLRELQGQVVVLDFWAIWCPPCRAGLPLLHEVDKWAREQALPVTVLTVNTLERGTPAEKAPDALLARAKGFWSQQKFTLPVLMDYNDQTAQEYQVGGLPTTVVIRADGVVHSYHQGFSPADYIASMKADITAAIAALEAPAAKPDADPRGR